MSVMEIPQRAAPRTRRAIWQRRVGIVLMTLLLVFVGLGAVWSISEVQYRDCLTLSDRDYREAGRVERITWPPSKTTAAQLCADKNSLPSGYLR